MFDPNVGVATRVEVRENMRAVRTLLTEVVGLLQVR